jgi:hypothetical protein
MAEHGTVSSYNNQRCRCDLCRQAMRERKRKYRATEHGAQVTRRHAKMSKKMQTLALKYIRENEPEVYKEIWREARCDD